MNEPFSCFTSYYFLTLKQAHSVGLCKTPGLEDDGALPSFFGRNMMELQQLDGSAFYSGCTNIKEIKFLGDKIKPSFKLKTSQHLSTTVLSSK